MSHVMFPPIYIFCWIKTFVIFYGFQFKIVNLKLTLFQKYHWLTRFCIRILFFGIWRYQKFIFFSQRTLHHLLYANNGSYKSFRKSFRIMCPLDALSPGSPESIAPNRFSKFDREHAFLSRFQFWSIYSPMGIQRAQNSKKISKTFFTIAYRVALWKLFAENTDQRTLAKPDRESLVSMKSLLPGDSSRNVLGIWTRCFKGPVRYLNIMPLRDKTVLSINLKSFVLERVLTIISDFTENLRFTVNWRYICTLYICTVWVIKYESLTIT